MRITMLSAFIDKPAFICRLTDCVQFIGKNQRYCNKYVAYMLPDNKTCLILNTYSKGRLMTYQYRSPYFINACS